MFLHGLDGLVKSKRQKARTQWGSAPWNEWPLTLKCCSRRSSLVTTHAARDSSASTQALHTPAPKRTAEQSAVAAAAQAHSARAERAGW